MFKNMTDFYRARACFSNLIRRCVQSSCRRRVSFNICLRRRRCISLHPPPRSSVTARENQCPPPSPSWSLLATAVQVTLPGLQWTESHFLPFYRVQKTVFAERKYFDQTETALSRFVAALLRLCAGLHLRKLCEKTLKIDEAGEGWIKNGSSLP